MPAKNERESARSNRVDLRTRRCRNMKPQFGTRKPAKSQWQLEERWFASTPEFARRIPLPFSVEAQNSAIREIGDRFLHPRVWNRPRIDIPAELGSSRVLLHLAQSITAR
jgi:hypothetical protein